MSCSSCSSTADTVKRPVGKHIGEYCSECDRWLRWIPQDWKNFIWPIGKKHKGHTLISILVNDKPYLVWAARDMSGTLQKRAQEALDSTMTSEDVPKDSEEQDAFDRLSRHSAPREEQPELRDDLPW